MSHEATHVATEAPLTSGMPLWLLEGFADYVALRDVDLPISTTAGQIIAQVRRDGVPDAPARAGRVRRHRDPPRGGVRERPGSPAWSSPTSAGEDALVRLYDDVRGGRGIGAALRSSVGLDEARADPAVAGPPGDARGDDRGAPGDRAAYGRGRRGARGRRRLRGRSPLLLVPWDPVPGGALSAPRPVVAASPPRRSRAARTSRAGPGSGAGRSLRGLAARGLRVLGFTRLGARWSTGCPGRGGCRCRWPWRRVEVIGRVADPAVRGRAAPARARLRAVEPGLGRRTPSTWSSPRPLDVVVTSLVLLVLVGAARRWPRAWPAVAGAGPRGAGAAGLVRLPAAGRAAVQLVHPAAGRPAAHPDPRPRRRRRAWTSTTCWSRTRRGARRR